MDLSVGWVLEQIGAQEGLNVSAEGIDDTCLGMVISSDKTFVQVARENSVLYNYQIVDGDPIRLRRRAVNDDLVIDIEIDETECVRRGHSPAVSFSRVDPSSLPRRVEVQHIDPERDYGTNIQPAPHIAAPRSNAVLSLSTDFVISAQQAKDIAFDILYRIWGQQLNARFEHPNMQIEPGDIIQLTSTKGTFILLVVNQTLNMPARTNSINAAVLLSSKGSTIVTAPVADQRPDPI